MLQGVRNAFDKKTFGENSTVTRPRDDYKEALVRFREAQKTAVAKREAVTRSISWRKRVRQSGATCSSGSSSANKHKMHKKYERRETRSVCATK